MNKLHKLKNSILALTFLVAFIFLFAYSVEASGSVNKDSVNSSNVPQADMTKLSTPLNLSGSINAYKSGGSACFNYSDRDDMPQTLCFNVDSATYDFYVKQLSTTKTKFGWFIALADNEGTTFNITLNKSFATLKEEGIIIDWNDFNNSGLNYVVGSNYVTITSLNSSVNWWFDPIIDIQHYIDYPSNRRIIQDKEGDIYVLTSDSSNLLLYNSSDLGQSWSIAINVSTSSSVMSAYIGEDNIIHIVHQYTVPNRQLKYIQYNATSEALITNVVLWQNSPVQSGHFADLVINPSDNYLYVVYRKYDTYYDYYDIMYMRCDLDGDCTNPASWSAEDYVADASAINNHSQQFPNIETDGTNVFAVWNDGGGAPEHNQIRYSVYPFSSNTIISNDASKSFDNGISVIVVNGTRMVFTQDKYNSGTYNDELCFSKNTSSSWTGWDCFTDNSLSGAYFHGLTVSSQGISKIYRAFNGSGGYCIAKRLSTDSGATWASPVCLSINGSTNGTVDDFGDRLQVSYQFNKTDDWDTHIVYLNYTDSTTRYENIYAQTQINISTNPSPVKIFNRFNISVNASNPAVTAINVTITYPNSTSITYTTTKIGGLFYTQNFTATNGTYYTNATADDNSTKSYDFTVTDNYLYLPSSYNSVQQAGLNFSVVTSIFEDTNENLSHTYSCAVNDGTPTNFSCMIPNNPFYVVSSGNMTLNITTNATTPDNTYSGNITIVRNIDNLTKVIPLTLTIATDFGQPYIINKTDWTLSMYTNETNSTSYLINNTGTYSLTNCVPTLTGEFVNQSWYSLGLDSTINIGEVKNLSIVFAFPTVGLYRGYLQVTCNATAGGATNTLASGNQPYIAVNVVSGGALPPAPPPAGGGGSTYVTIVNFTLIPNPQDILVAYFNEKPETQLTASRILKSCQTDNTDFSCYVNGTKLTVVLEKTPDTFYKRYSTRVTAISTQDETSEALVYFAVYNFGSYISIPARQISRETAGENIFFAIQGNAIIGIRWWWIILLGLALSILVAKVLSARKFIRYR